MTSNCAGVFIPPNVTPLQGLATQIVTGGTSLIVIPPGAYGGYIWNPSTAGDQGLGASEFLYVNPLGPAALSAFGATIALGNGATFQVPVAKSTLAIWVNAATSGHRFTAIYWTGS